MPTRQTYTVLIPFPTHAGHWSVVGEELDLLDGVGLAGGHMHSMHKKAAQGGGVLDQEKKRPVGAGRLFDLVGEPGWRYWPLLVIGEVRRLRPIAQ